MGHAEFFFPFKRSEAGSRLSLRIFVIHPAEMIQTEINWMNYTKSEYMNIRQSTDIKSSWAQFMNESSIPFFSHGKLVFWGEGLMLSLSLYLSLHFELVCKTKENKNRNSIHDVPLIFSSSYISMKLVFNLFLCPCIICYLPLFMSAGSYEKVATSKQLLLV